MSLELKFDPRTIEHLGVKMYSTLPPALAELISNAYDADSPGVAVEFIELNKTPKSIVIKDEGDGMSLSDIQNKFLVIGRNRRNDDGDKPSNKFKRMPTGKKGLGKLALFGLANEIIVDTAKDGLRNRFKLNWADLLSSDSVYSPIIEIQDQQTPRTNGTTIKLSDLKRKSPFDLNSLADSLSKIFSVDPSFSITLKKGTDIVRVDGERRYKDIDQQFQWTEKDLVKEDSPYHGKISLKFVTAKTPIPPSAGLRGITIYSRGKLVNAPEYFSESTSSHFFQYLTGSINADFIDLLNEDVISTNRQSINWDQPDMADFREYLGELISETARDWRNKRAKKKEEEINTATGINTEHWMSTLPTDVKGPVQSILAHMTKNEDISESLNPIVNALYNIVPEYPLLHWRHLHLSIKDGVYDLYKNSQYGFAADQATKMYAARIREIAKIDEDGTRLADVFNLPNNKPPTIAINDLSTSSLKNMQEGQSHLTRGLMQGFRNPINHAPMDRVVPEIISELDCLNILSLVSYLVGKLDYAEEKLKEKADS
ncbi:TIGR02391 family protein [Pseudomonas abyssi]|uniref:Conserved hypothetical protein CHP02391 domain-containing protein n=1 Tax=Pseudomonas abyssi TaxID=170540 RepID=A0A395R9T2_9PSED|nr:TIGR02391 family protein [Halopseudomonas gallaeciensis]RGP56866.1 hypothetical protein ASB58_05815 [Halopseudomonas gallaeciensis]